MDDRYEGSSSRLLPVNDTKARPLFGLLPTQMTGSPSSAGSWDRSFSGRATSESTAMSGLRAESARYLRSKPIAQFHATSLIPVVWHDYLAGDSAIPASSKSTDCSKCPSDDIPGFNPGQSLLTVIIDAPFFDRHERSIRFCGAQDCLNDLWEVIFIVDGHEGLGELIEISLSVWSQSIRNAFDISVIM